MGNNKQLMGALFLALGLFLFWLLPYGEYTKISELKAAVAERDATLQERIQIQQKVKDLTAQYNQKSADIRTLSAIVPTKKELAEVVSALQAMAGQSGVQLNEVTFGEGTLQPDKPYTTMRLAMTGRAGYASIRSLLDAVERNVRLIDVQSIKVSTDQQTSLLNFEIQADAYFLK